MKELIDQSNETERLLLQAPQIVAVALRRGWARMPAWSMGTDEFMRRRSSLQSSAARKRRKHDLADQS